MEDYSRRKLIRGCAGQLLRRKGTQLLSQAAVLHYVTLTRNQALRLQQGA